jgi:hypothetical protein
MAARRLIILAAALALGALAVSMPADAADWRSATAEAGAQLHLASSSSDRRGPKVRSYAARRGGYSYRAEDTINTYGDSRTRYGSTNSYRFWGTDRQSSSGPFDHGFFFDSGIGPRGGDSPYMN